MCCTRLRYDRVARPRGPLWGCDPPHVTHRPAARYSRARAPTWLASKHRRTLFRKATKGGTLVPATPLPKVCVHALDRLGCFFQLLTIIPQNSCLGARRSGQSRGIGRSRPLSCRALRQARDKLREKSRFSVQRTRFLGRGVYPERSRGAPRS